MAPVTASRALRSAALILGCMALVLWIRVTPLSLASADDWASEIVPRSGDESERAKVAREIRSQLSFEGEDGREYPYLGDFDSYHWLRLARNYVRQGTACDAVVDGQCRDTYASAPVGSRMIYTRSLHVLGIVALHKAITFFNPRHPLVASAFWVPVVVGVLGVIPAFLIGRRLGGSVGGVCAAALVSLNPLFLQRSMGSDNDVWNGVLPLFVAAALLAGLEATAWPRLVLWAALAGGLTALQATTWRGWLFIYAIVLSTLLLQAIASSVRYVRSAGTPRVWRSPDVRRIAAAGAAFYVATEVMMRLGGYEKAYLSALSMFRGDDVAPAEAGYWPRVLNTVEEFSKPGLREIVHASGGTVIFLAGVLGILLLVLPKGRWRSSHVTLVLFAFSLWAWVLAAGHLGRNATVAVFAVSLAAPLLWPLLAGGADYEAPPPAAILVAVWFLAALLFAHEGARYPVLLAPPLGAGVAVLAGRLSGWLTTRAEPLAPAPHRPLAGAVVCLVVAGVILARPVRQAYATARLYTPTIDDAWWLSLEKIKREAAADAIVNTWWDYGYWVKYVAERRVSSTGGSLLTHVPHWLAKAVAAPSERQTVGILRMLNCGSDALPLPEGRRGAYGKIMAAGPDAVTAYSIVLDLVERERGEADSYLARRGFSPSARADILESTHCAPPESYFIVTSDMLQKSPAWLHLGLWDMRRAYVAREARFLPRPQALADLAARFEYAEPEAARLYAEAGALASEPAIEAFIAPRHGKIFAKWQACRGGTEGSRLSCPIDVSVDPDGVSLLVFSYDPASPASGRLRRRGRGRAEVAGPSDDGTPAVIVVAGPERMETEVSATPTYADVGILVDVANRRILAGMPELIRSTFTHLMYLDGRYATHFEKFDDRKTDFGNRVVTWKVRWDGR